jgi:hypothetical protein
VNCSGDGGKLPHLATRGVDSAESEPMEVKSEQELSTELKEFIDQLIVPLLVELVKNGHLYSAPTSYYDGEGPCAEAAEEAA